MKLARQTGWEGDTGSQAPFRKMERTLLQGRGRQAAFLLLANFLILALCPPPLAPHSCGRGRRGPGSFNGKGGTEKDCQFK